jgi:hypothetical protein
MECCHPRLQDLAPASVSVWRTQYLNLLPMEDRLAYYKFHRLVMVTDFWCLEFPLFNVLKYIDFCSFIDSHRRRSSISESGLLSLSGSFLDATSPEKVGGQGDLSISVPTPQDLKAMSPRHQVFMELLHTEMNYVEILETIVEVWYYWIRLFRPQY